MLLRWRQLRRGSAGWTARLIDVNQYLASRRLPDPLAYGLGCLFMAGLAIRGITTGR